MIRYVGVHGANDTAVIDYPRDVRERLAHFNAPLARSIEFERRRHIAAPLCLAVQRPSWLLPFVLFQCWLRIECVNVRWAAVHEQKDDVLRARREMGVLPEFSRRGLLRVEQRSQTNHAE